MHVEKIEKLQLYNYILANYVPQVQESEITFSASSFWVVMFEKFTK